jgi:hypothetical protein
LNIWKLLRPPAANLGHFYPPIYSGAPVWFFYADERKAFIPSFKTHQYFKK